VSCRQRYGIDSAPKQALKSVEVAQQQLKANKAQRLPSISATTNYQRLASIRLCKLPRVSTILPNWTVGIGLRIRSSPADVRGSASGRSVGGGSIASGCACAGNKVARCPIASWRSSLKWKARQASVGAPASQRSARDIAEVRFREGISTARTSETRNQLQQASLIARRR
jgi:hypothetical protein